MKVRNKFYENKNKKITLINTGINSVDLLSLKIIFFIEIINLYKNLTYKVVYIVRLIIRKYDL